MFAGDALEIGGEIIGGEGVFLAAEFGDEMREIALLGLCVPLNIRCSRKCAMPLLPRGSSAEPLRYQTICVTTGARWSGMTTTSMPLSSLKCSPRSGVRSPSPFEAASLGGNWSGKTDGGSRADSCFLGNLCNSANIERRKPGRQPRSANFLSALASHGLRRLEPVEPALLVLVLFGASRTRCRPRPAPFP